MKKSLLEQVTESAGKLFDGVKYLDESLREYVPESYENKVLDFYSLDLHEIEQLLNIQDIGNQITKHMDSVLLDEWYEVVNKIEEIRSMNDFYTFTSIQGYKIVDDHYIRLYYTVHVSNS